MATKNLGRVIGLSAYEIWLQAGNTGTEEEFLNSLKGADAENMEIVQTIGEGKTAVMSQKAVSDLFRKSNPPIELTMTDGAFVQSSGNTAKFDWGQYSNFIPVVEGEQYRLYTRYGGNVPAAVFFREDKIGASYDVGYVGDINKTEGYGTEEFTIPSGANYIVINMREPAKLGNVPVIEKFSTYIENIPTELDKIQTELDKYATLKGKTIVNLGDSIFGQETRDNRSPVSYLLSEYTGANVINCAFPGTRMSSRGASSVYNCFDFPSIAQAIVSGDFTTQENTLTTDNAGDNVIPYQYDNNFPKLKAIDWAQVDIITLNYGTNDWTANVSLENFKAAAIENIGAIMEKYPHITVILISPTWRFWYNADGTYMEDSTERLNNGINLVAVCDADKEIAGSLNINLIDAYNIGINKYNRAYYFPTTELDGTHHAENGRKKLARYLASQIMSII